MTSSGNVEGPLLPLEMTNPLLTVSDLSVIRGGRSLLEIPRFEVADAEILAVLGPNGSGKSTLLRCLALLERPASGEISFRGQAVRWSDSLDYRRRTAVLFQEPLLLDTTVRDNVATGLRLRGMRGSELARRVTPWLERLGIDHLAQRRAHTLSGGEARRTSLARALVLAPAILFLDEPFSALDAPTRAGFIRELSAILAEQRTTTVLITHDQSEAWALADRVGVLVGGRLREIGPIEDVLGNPADPQVRQFLAATELPRKRGSDPA